MQGLFKDFQGPEVAFSSTNSPQRFTAWTVLQQYLISISVITNNFSWQKKTGQLPYILTYKTQN